MDKRILVFIPMYNCEKQIPRVLAQIDDSVQSASLEVMVVDNRSSDKSVERAKEGLAKLGGCSTKLVKNDANYSLGGSHKVAFNYAIDQGFDYLIVLHGDDQGNIHDVWPLIEQEGLDQYECLLGSRFTKGSQLIGYQRFRIFGNIVFNYLISLAIRRKVTDMGAGLNAYRVSFLKSKFYMTFPNDLTFNVFMLFYTVWKRASFRFFPLTWREDDQVSNAKLFQQSMHILSLTKDYVFHSKDIFTQRENSYSRKEYTYHIVYEHNIQVSNN
jgi:glycosyltransferase involved in cell wall biosynthesis